MDTSDLTYKQVLPVLRVLGLLVFMARRTGFSSRVENCQKEADGMSWLSRLFGEKQKPLASRPLRSLAGRNVALAVVDNPGGVVVIDGSGGGAAEGVTEKMIRDFIQKDLARYPELRAKAAAIQEIVIVTDATVASSNYAQDMTIAYLRYMNQGGWATPDGLHIFETLLAQVTVYIAYGI